MKNKWLNYFICLFTVVFLTGCVSNYSVVDSISPETNNLEAGASVYIITPEDGKYSGKTYEGSGRITAFSLEHFLLKHTRNVKIGAANTNIDQALDEATLEGYRYAMQLEIINWEPRNAAWSGRRTKVLIRASIYDLQLPDENKLIATMSLDAAGRSFTVVSQTAEEIAKYLLGKMVESLYE